MSADPTLDPTVDSAPEQKRPRSIASRLAMIVVPLVVVVLLAEVATRQWIDPLHNVTAEQKFDPFVVQHVDRMVELRDGAPADRIDVVVSGTSVVAVSINPDIAGPAANANVYNAAIGCANLEIQAEWLPNWVADFAQPDTVVIGVNPGDFDKEACVRGWDDRNAFDDTSFDPDWELFKISSLWRQRKFLAEPQNWKVFWEAEEVQGFWDLDIDAKTGFWNVVAWREDIDIDTFLLNPGRTNLRVDKEMTDSLAAAISELSEQGITVVVAEIPMAQRFADNLTDPATRDFDEVLAMTEKIAVDNGATYLPADPRFRQNDLFIDGSHMTPDGAEEFSVWFGSQLDGLVNG